MKKMFQSFFTVEEKTTVLHRWCLKHIPKYQNTCNPMKKVDDANRNNSSETWPHWNGGDLQPQDIWPSRDSKS